MLKFSFSFRSLHIKLHAYYDSTVIMSETDDLKVGEASVFVDDVSNC